MGMDNFSKVRSFEDLEVEDARNGAQNTDVTVVDAVDAVDTTQTPE